MRVRSLFTAVAACVLVVTACGGDDDESESSSSAAVTSAALTSTTVSESSAVAEPSSAPTDVSPGSSVDEAAWATIVEAANDDGKVTVYGTLNQAAVDALPAAFNEAYPEITLDYQRLGVADTEARLQAELGAGNLTVDVFEDPTGPFLETMSADGNLAVLQMPALNNPDFDREAFQRTPDSFTGYQSAYAWAWNTELLPAGIHSWDDYLTLEPGSLGLTDPSISPVLTDTYKSIEEAAGEGYLDEVADADLDPQLYPGGNPAMAALAAGEIAAVFPVALSQVLQQIDAGAPVDYEVYDGSWAGLIHLAGVAGSPHPNAAQVYMDWFLSPAGQQVVADTGNAPVLSSVPTVYDSSTVTLRPAQDVTQAEVDAFLQRFNELFG